MSIGPQFTDLRTANGRLVIDVDEAINEFGKEVCSRLKRTPDGQHICWPQPSDDPNDPLNWNQRRKNIVLMVYCFAAVVPDFNVGLGISPLFALAEEFHTTTEAINNLTSNWTIFLLAWGGLLSISLVSRFGRLPVLFWSQLLGVAFLVGCTVAPTLKIFATMRGLSAFVSTTSQITGLYAIKDMFFFHEETKKLNIWAYAFILSPYLSPFFGNFMIAANVNWRWVYGLGCFYGGFVVFLIVFFGEETMFDRNYPPKPSKKHPIWSQVEALIGITGYREGKIAKRPSAFLAVVRTVLVQIRPVMFMMSIYIALTFAWVIGINSTLVVFLRSPPPLGYSFGGNQVSAVYVVALVSNTLGQIIGHYLNDLVANRYISRHKGVFEPEARLPLVYLASLLMVLGQIFLGLTLERLGSIAGIVFGWGMYLVGVMLSVTVVYAYCSDCFPHRQGEVSVILNGWRVLLGFSTAYFEVPWATKSGPLIEFGVQSAIIVGATLLIPIVQWKGEYLRGCMKPLL